MTNFAIVKHKVPENLSTTILLFETPSPSQHPTSLTITVTTLERMDTLTPQQRLCCNICFLFMVQVCMYVKYYIIISHVPRFEHIVVDPQTGIHVRDKYTV